MKTQTMYSTLFMRLLMAVGRMSPSTAAVKGMHWERWARRRYGI